MPLATEREAGHGARAAAAVGSAAATSRAALRTFADLHAIADGGPRYRRHAPLPAAAAL